MKYYFKPFKILKKFTERGEKFLLFFFVRLPMNLNTKHCTPIAYNSRIDAVLIAFILC